MPGQEPVGGTMAPRLAALRGGCLAAVRRTRRRAESGASPAAGPSPEPTRTSAARARSPISGSRATSASRSATIRTYMVVQAGDPFDPAKLDQSLKNLFATGLFADVTLAARAIGLVVDGGREPDHQPDRVRGQPALEDETLTARSSCARAWSTPARACRTPSAASSSSTAATAASPRPSSPRSSSSSRTASTWCSRSTRGR